MGPGPIGHGRIMAADSGPRRPTSESQSHSRSQAAFLELGLDQVLLLGGSFKDLVITAGSIETTPMPPSGHYLPRDESSCQGETRPFNSWNPGDGISADTIWHALTSAGLYTEWSRAGNHHYYDHILRSFHLRIQGALYFSDIYGYYAFATDDGSFFFLSHTQEFARLIARDARDAEVILWQGDGPPKLLGMWRYRGKAYDAEGEDEMEGWGEDVEVNVKELWPGDDIPEGLISLV